MTTPSRDRQRERLNELSDSYVGNDGQTFIDYLLDNGVTVEVRCPSVVSLSDGDLQCVHLEGHNTPHQAPLLRGGRLTWDGPGVG